MSRIGKKPIEIPDQVEVKLDGSVIGVSGPKGELSLRVHPQVKFEIKDKAINVTVDRPEDKKQASLWGLFRTLVGNMILGVTVGFKKELEINGIGFKAQVSGSKLVLNVGFSHPVEYLIPQGIQMVVDKNAITVSGIDKQQVGQVTAEIRAIKKPEPYKGKGIKYINEVIRRKAGKVVKGSEG
ncbi:MAG TPA: 50S ribosomal protein L6 [Patescibacteria group bacterium]|nr:50S ribosomal protein L6 [Patescibacteria group bacterium]